MLTESRSSALRACPARIVISPPDVAAHPGNISYEEYHPYGTTAWWTDPGSTVSQKRYRYTGKEKDEESGLYYHGARYHAPWLARWTTSDPIALGGGINRYRYCSCNPVSRSDATGTRDFVAGSAVAAPQVITVEEGDTLESISTLAYGDSSLAERIYGANYSIVADDGTLSVGSQLFLPPKDVQAYIEKRAVTFFDPDIRTGKVNLSAFNGMAFDSPNVVPAALSDYWEPLGDTAIRLKEGMSAAQAIQALATGSFTCECATGQEIFAARILLETVGAEAFDRWFGREGETNQSLTLGKKEGHPSAFEELFWNPGAETISDLRPGDLTYFRNNPNYETHQAEGNWRGENAIYLGYNHFAGHGLPYVFREDEIKEVFRREYNRGLPDSVSPITEDQLDLIPGLDLAQTRRFNRPVIEQMFTYGTGR